MLQISISFFVAVLNPFLRSMPYDLLPGAEPVDTALS